MADPAPFSFRNPRTGETRVITNPREIEASVVTGWVPENPDTRVQVLDFVEGRATARSVPLGELGRVYDQTGAIRLLDRVTGPSVIADTTDRMSERAMTEFGGLAATQSFLDVASLGGASLAQDLIDPEVGGIRRDVIESNPHAALAGTVAGFAPQLLAGGAGLGRVAAGTGIGGLARGAGMAAEEMAAALGVTGRASAFTGLIAEETAAGVALEGALSQQQDRAFQAENALLDAGVGMAFGLGIRGLASGRAGLGERFARRAESTPSGRNAGEGLMDAADVVDGRRTIAEVNEMLTGPEPGRELFARGVEVLGDQPTSLAGAITRPRFQEMAIDPGAQMTHAANEAGTALERMIAHGDPRTGRGAGSERMMTDAAFDQSWLGRFEDDFAAMDPDAIRGAVRAELQGLSANITDTLRGRGENIAGAQREGMVSVGRTLNDLAARVEGMTPRQLFGELVELKRTIRGNVGDVTDMPLLKGTVEAVRALPQNTNTWGRIGEIQAVRDRGIHDLDTQRGALLSALGRPDLFSRGDRVTSSAAIRRAFREAGNEVYDRFSDVQTALAGYTRVVDELATKVTAYDPRVLAAFKNDAREVMSWLEHGAAHHRVKNMLAEIEGRGSRSHGALSMMGFGGGMGVPIMAGIMGGPVGALVGALASVPFAFLIRPGSTVMRVARLRQAMSNTANRVEVGLGNVRRAATGGFRQRLGRFAARGVQSYYDLENPKRRMREFEEMRRDITEMVQNPELAMDRLAYTHAALNDIDPSLGDQANFAAIRALFHLYAHMPQPITDPLTGDRVMVPPSLDEIGAFARRYAVVEDPLVVLDRLAQGRLQPDEVDTLRTVYPEVHGMVVAGVASELADVPPGRLRYDFRVSVGTLFGFQTDPTLDPAFIAGMQNQGYQTEQQQQAVQGPGRPMQRPMTGVRHTPTTVQRLSLPE